MLAKFNDMVVTLVKTIPTLVSVLGFSVLAVLVALPLALGGTYAIEGTFTSVDIGVTIATTSIIAMPVGYLICSVILHLQRSEERLAEARSALADQVDELADARRDAVAANHAKSAFLAQMSHELRTPLNAVIGFSDILAKQNEIGVNLSTDDVIEYAKLISQGGNTLLSLVNDLLDLSKIEAGEMELSAERLCAGEAIESAVNCVSILAQNRDITLDVDDRARDLELTADKRALGQILVNLLSNAVKFSPRYSAVTIGVRQSTQYLSFNITDRGNGMSPDEQEKAVQPFAQLNNALVATEKGTGLGLPIVKSLIEMEGGTLLIESEPDRGTTVSIRYPADRVVRERQPMALSA